MKKAIGFLISVIFFEIGIYCLCHTPPWHYADKTIWTTCEQEFLWNGALFMGMALGSAMYTSIEVVG